MARGYHIGLGLLVILAFFLVVYIFIADNSLADLALAPVVALPLPPPPPAEAEPVAEGPLSSERIALVWVFAGDKVSPYFDLSIYTLFAHSDALAFDLHVISGAPLEQAQTQTQTPEGRMWEAHRHRVFFHLCSADEWKRRISSRIGVEIGYSFKNKGRKVADLKPMLADLFPDIIDATKYAWWVFGDSDGFFGSYDKIFRYKTLFSYDIISGYNLAGPSLDQFAFGGWDHHSIGSWTMLRNNNLMNTLYRRSVNYVSMIQDGDKVYAFDENTLEPLPGIRESFHSVLENSNDVRRCCINNKIPQVRRDTDHSLVVIDLDSDFLSNDVKTVVRWRRDHPVMVTVEGHIGNKKLYRNQTAHGLFVHMLQWKYSKPSFFNAKLKELNAAVWRAVSDGQIVSCFEFVGDANKRNTDDLYSWNFC
jgi:hypothetical protein